MSRIRVLIADDHTLFRQGLVRLLESAPDLEVVGEAVDGREAIRLVEKTHPHVIIMDLSMPGLGGLEAIRRIRRIQCQAEVLVLSMHDDEVSVSQALQAGAVGYVVKTDNAEELLTAVRAAHRGQSYLSPSISRLVIEGYLQRRPTENVASSDKLTSREREILQLLAEGHSNKEIAKLLNLSVKTVETHRTNLMKKLGLHSLAELVRYAIRNGLVQA